MAVLGVVVAAASAASAGMASGPQTAAQAVLRKDIADVLNASAAAWRVGDLDQFMTFYEHSQDITYASGATLTKGYDAIRAMYASRFGGGGQLGVLTIDIVDMQVLGPDHVYVVGRFQLDPGGDRPLHSGLTTLVFRRGSHGWRIVADHS